MKRSVRELALIVAVMGAVIVLVVGLTGGSVAVTYLASFACMAGWLWWEKRQEARS